MTTHKPEVLEKQVKNHDSQTLRNDSQEVQVVVPAHQLYLVMGDKAQAGKACRFTCPDTAKDVPLEGEDEWRVVPIRPHTTVILHPSP